MSSSCEIDERPKGWQALLKSWYFWKPFVGISVGALAGLFYYYYFGAGSGISSITSDPWSNTTFGGMIGFLITKKPCSTC